MMLLAFFLWVFLSLGFPLYVLAGPSPSTIQRPPFFSAVIPSCAQDCLTNFITTSFPTWICPSQQDRSCLCTRQSTSGFTLGEGALRCVASSCPAEYESNSVQAYTLCSGIASAIPMTHETITVTVQLLTTVTTSVWISPRTTSERTPVFSSTSCITMTTARLTSSVLISSSSIDSTASMSLPTSIITASGSPTFPNFISTQVPSRSYVSLVSTAAFASISSSSSIGVIPATATTLASKPVLTRPQIAGVATAGAATAVIAVGIFAFFFCCRKRRKNRDSNSSFGQDQLQDIRQSLPGDLVPAIDSSKVSRQQVAEAPPKAQRFLGVPSRYNEQTWGTYNNAVNPGDVGVGTAPGSGHSTQSSQETPPHSAASYRTTSRLLPDKPTISSLYPAPLNLHSSRRPESAVARSAEGGGIRLIAPDPPPKPEKIFQPNNPVQADPFVDHSSDPRARMYAKERAAKHAQLPLILTAGGEKLGDSSRTLPADSQLSEPPPVHGYQFPRWEGALPLSTANPHTIHRKPLSQATDTDGNPPHASNPSFDPYASSHVRSSRSGPLARRSKGVRPETYLTMGSDTSFEDDCDETDEPSRPNTTLSPVVEQDTPRIRSPISNIRYPPIPGAAASSIQRRQSPPSPTRRPPTRRPNLPPATQNTRVRPPAHVSFRSPLPQYSNMRQVARPPYQQIPPLPRATPYDYPRQIPASTMVDPRGRQQQQYPNDGNTESAKWKILCGPGSQDDLIINLGSAYSGVGVGSSNGGGGGGGEGAPSQNRHGA